jgi:hypothetical protein
MLFGSNDSTVFPPAWPGGFELSLHSCTVKLLPLELFISAADWQVYIALRAARYRQELELTVLNQALRRSMDG